MESEYILKKREAAKRKRELLDYWKAHKNEMIGEMHQYPQCKAVMQWDINQSQKIIETLEKQYQRIAVYTRGEIGECMRCPDCGGFEIFYVPVGGWDQGKCLECKEKHPVYVFESAFQKSQQDEKEFDKELYYKRLSNTF